MQARSVILPVIAILAISVWWIWNGLPNSAVKETQAQGIESQHEPAVSDSPRVELSLARDVLQASEEELAKVEIEVQEPGGTANITGFVVNRLSGDRFHAWVVIYQDGEEYGGTDCYPEEGFEFEVERGHEYFIQVQKIIDGDGYRVPDPPLRYSSEDSTLDARRVFVPEQSDQTIWEIGLEIFQTGTAVGKILAPDGTPIRGAQYQLIRTELVGEAYSTGGRASVDETGSFRKVFGESKTAILRFDFRFAKDLAHRVLTPPQSPEITLLEGQNLDLGIFRATHGQASLSGIVLDQFGDPYVGLEINCHQVDRGRAALLGTMKTGEYGHFFFHGLGVGEIEIDLTTRGSHMRYLLKDMRYAWEVATVKTTIQANSVDQDLGEIVVPRPVAFRQKVEIEGGSKDSYFIRIETMVDAIKAEMIETLTLNHPQEMPLPGWTIAQAVAPYSWTETPPWFNYNPEVTVLYEQDAIREIACRLPHAPILITVFESQDGVVGLQSQVTVYPSSVSPAVVVIPIPK